MKNKIIPSMFFTQTFILCFAFAVFSQSSLNSSPVKWEKYRVEKAKASFLLPKMPVVVEEGYACHGERTLVYGSYADGAAFVVRITQKIAPPQYCPEKKINEISFGKRIYALVNNPLLPLKARDMVGAKAKEVILDGDRQIYKLIDDPKNERWFELSVTGADDTKEEVKNFLASLDKSKTADGIEIGDGAEKTLGDEIMPKVEILKKDDDGKISYGIGDGDGISAGTLKPDVSSNKGPTEGVRIVLKPRSNYTETARRNQTQGKVLLRVTFMSNGGIGGIGVISGLADGLTEEAIAAARKLLFIPANRGGVRYSVTKPVEYTFTIY